MIKSLTKQETMKIMEKTWASTEDVKKIGCVGRNKALKIKDEIRIQMIEDNIKFPRNLVAMKYVAKYFDLEDLMIGGEING